MWRGVEPSVSERPRRLFWLQCSRKYLGLWRWSYVDPLVLHLAGFATVSPFLDYQPQPFSIGQRPLIWDHSVTRYQLCGSHGWGLPSPGSLILHSSLTSPCCRVVELQTVCVCGAGLLWSFGQPIFSWQDNLWGKQDFMDLLCGRPFTWVKKMGNARGALLSPCVGLAAFLTFSLLLIGDLGSFSVTGYCYIHWYILLLSAFDRLHLFMHYLVLPNEMALKESWNHRTVLQPIW